MILPSIAAYMSMLYFIFFTAKLGCWIRENVSVWFLQFIPQIWEFKYRILGQKSNKCLLLETRKTQISTNANMREMTQKSHNTRISTLDVIQLKN